MSLKQRLFVGMLSLTLSSVALAHAHLASSQPADKAVLNSAPAVLSLSFTEGIEPSFSQITVSSAGGQLIALAPLITLSNDNTVLLVKPLQSLNPGLYSVEWKVLSIDGHKTTGTYQFKIK